MIDKAALATLPDSRRDPEPSSRKMLQKFRRMLEKQYVHYWHDADDLEKQFGRTLPLWIRQNKRAGWVRYELHEQGRKELADAGQVIEVLRYLLRHLLPEDQRLSLERLERLVPLNQTATLISAIEQLLREYVFPRIKGGDARVYFAYRLSEPVKVPESELIARYRIGISTSEERFWEEGLYVGERSNIDYVYSKAQAHQISDTLRARKNQPVAGERSIMTAPVRFGSGSVGVLGFSSPYPKGTDAFKELANEVATVFSALFYVFAQSVRKDCHARGETPSDDQIAERIRGGLAEAFAAKFDSV
jgi:hypothetical protein